MTTRRDRGFVTFPISHRVGWISTRRIGMLVAQNIHRDAGDASRRRL